MSFAILRCIAQAGALVSAVTLTAWLPTAYAAVPDIPTVEGPITGPGEMQPGIRPGPGGTNLEDFGYVTDEYFVSGMVTSGTATPAYKTRILVRRPDPAERFSGMVVSEVMHSNGFAVTFAPARKSVMLRGHVQVEIAGQQSNVNVTIKPFNPDRYASLGTRSTRTRAIT
ncbi:MAG TPA: alpha/beta hydrolase domain-containing protein [Burkholderiales bacterium]|nr:alpha/beta hydrolase domain-containing protein [Burkholderiales bacterium]